LTQIPAIRNIRSIRFLCQRRQVVAAVSTARRNHAIYGSYGISVFAVRDITLDELAQQRPLVRFERLAVVTVGVLRAAGLRLDPTGRNPRHFDVTFNDLDVGVESLCNCEHRVVVNPYYEG
jgi:hypothetical protein